MLDRNGNEWTGNEENTNGGGFSSGGFADEQPADAFPPEPPLTPAEEDALYQAYMADLIADERAVAMAWAMDAALRMGVDPQAA